MLRALPLLLCALSLGTGAKHRGAGRWAGGSAGPASAPSPDAPTGFDAIACKKCMSAVMRLLTPSKNGCAGKSHTHFPPMCNSPFPLCVTVLGLVNFTTRWQRDDHREHESKGICFRPPTYFSHMSRPTFPISHLFFLSFQRVPTAYCDTFMPKKRQCTAYSFGIEGIWDWDKAMVTAGCKVSSFDPLCCGGARTVGPGHNFIPVALATYDGIAKAAPATSIDR